MTGPIIELKDVTKTFKGKKAVDGVSFSIEPGSVTALLGQNGAGKTTTVSMMLGLLRPSAGEVKVFGADPGELAVRERLGAMLQESNLIDGMKTVELIDLFRSYYPKPLDTQTLLRLSGLEEARDKRAVSLSGGQRRRLIFAVALAGDPELLFLDEPTTSMDIGSREVFWQTIRGLRERGKTIVLTTHYMDEVESIADRVIVIHQGRLIADGSLAQIKARTAQTALSFVPLEPVDDQTLRSLPGVYEVRRNGPRVSLIAEDTDRLIYAIIGQGMRVKEIETHKSGLEEALNDLIQEASAS